MASPSRTISKSWLGRFKSKSRTKPPTIYAGSFCNVACSATAMSRVFRSEVSALSSASIISDCGKGLPFSFKVLIRSVRVTMPTTSPLSGSTTGTCPQPVFAMISLRRARESSGKTRISPASMRSSTHLFRLCWRARSTLRRVSKPMIFPSFTTG